MTPNENGDVDWDALYGMFDLLFYIFFLKLTSRKKFLLQFICLEDDQKKGGSQNIHANPQASRGISTWILIGLILLGVKIPPKINP